MKKASVLIAIGIFCSINILFGQEKFKSDTCNTISLTTEDLNKYLGVYSSTQISLKIRITKVDTRLIARATGQSSIPLVATEKDEFKFEPVDLKMVFNIEKNEMVLTQHGIKYLFTKESNLKFITDTFNKESNLKFKTDTFNFVFEGKKLSGFIDTPVNRDPSALIIIVPGDGPTSFGESFWAYDSLFSNFTNLGISCFSYDKEGCGKSEGEYNHDQTVQNSAKEIITAIAELKRRNIKGSDKIGLWGISRGGYICPLVIQEYPSIAFWISVSGPDGLNSGDFMFESYLRSSGKSESQARLLVEEFKNGNYIFENGGTYEEFMKSEENFRKDSLCMAYTGADVNITKEEYYKEQASIRSNLNYKRDSITKSIIIVPDFKNILTKIQCPVLAIFVEKDSQVDWKKTMSLYQETLGKADDNKLTIKTFPNGNHGIRKCKTGALNEVIGKKEFCDGYIETMTSWLKENGFGK